MPIQYQQGTTNTEGSSNSVAYTSPNLLHDLLVVVCGEESSAGNITGISDTAGGTGNTGWVGLPQQSNGGHISRVFYCLNCKAGANTVSFAVSGTPSGYGQIGVSEFSGVSYVDGTPGQSTSASPSIATSEAAELVVGCEGDGNTSPYANTGWSNACNNVRLCIIYQIESSTGTYTPAYVQTSNPGYSTLGFTAVALPPSPASITPTGDEQGYTGNVTVSGTNFSTPTLSFSGTGITVNSYSVQNSTTCTANITISASAALTARDVIITNADTQTGTLAAAFTITSGAPSPASILPTSGVQGATINVTVSGTNFSTGTLSFSGAGITVNSYSVQNATTVTANITISASAALTARDVIITNADTQTGTLSAAFTILSGAIGIGAGVPEGYVIFNLDPDSGTDDIQVGLTISDIA